jgi:hypothetical protein
MERKILLLGSQTLYQGKRLHFYFSINFGKVITRLMMHCESAKVGEKGPVVWEANASTHKTMSRSLVARYRSDSPGPGSRLESGLRGVGVALPV